MRRLLLGPYSQHALRRATTATLVMQWVIVVTGATVRLTGSGLGCPNWPTCTKTRPVPALELHAIIEFLNRMTATPTLIASVAAAWIAWRLTGVRRRELRIATALTVVGVLVQAVIGALTVVLELPPEVVSVHFLVSVGLLTSATFAWHAAREDAPLVRAATHLRARSTAGVAMLLALLVVVVAGVLTTASGPHSGSSGTGPVVDRFGVFDLAVTLHARGAYAFLVLVLLLTWWRARRGPALRDLGVVAVLVAVQITLGEIQFRSGLPWQVVLAHVATAGLLWIVTARVAIDAATSRAPRGLDTPADPVTDVTRDASARDDRPAGSGAAAR